MIPFERVPGLAELAREAEVQRWMRTGAWPRDRQPRRAALSAEPLTVAPAGAQVRRPAHGTEAEFAAGCRCSVCCDGFARRRGEVQS